MADRNENRTPREMASQQINATNPGRLAMQNAAGGGIGDIDAAADAIGDLEPEASEGDFMQLMYEQSSELDAVDRITQARKQRR